MSSYNNWRKFNRLEKRLKQHSNQLVRISQLCADAILSFEFINERVSPIVFGDLIEEHEDAKINLILNGFENVFIEENSSESVIISYFDTLRSLRYVDIKRLLYFTGKSDCYTTPDINSEEHAILENSDNKLISLGLIFKDKSRGIEFGVIYPEEKTVTAYSKESVRTTKYADNFVEFISDNTIELN